MSDPITREDIEKWNEDVFNRWVGDLRTVMPKIESWWKELKLRLSEQHPDLADIHWPAGPVSHPRIIAIYRKYFFEIVSRNALIEAQTAEFLDSRDIQPDEELWGETSEDNDRLVDGTPPNVILLERLVEEVDDLRPFFENFAFLPIGEDEDLRLC